MPTNDLDPTVALAEKRSELDAIPADQVKDSPYPPATMVGEANALYLVADRHRAALVSVKLDEKFIDDLRKRAQALSGAQAARALVPDTKRSAAELAAEEEAFTARNELYAAGRYATRANPQAQSTLDKISEGSGHDDLIQDLKDLALFCQTYQTVMKTIGVELPQRSQHALELANKFETLLAERRTTSDEERAATDLRDRAATHLFEAMSEIRAAGSFKFRNDPTVLPLFRSAYRRRHRGGGGSGTPSNG